MDLEAVIRKYSLQNAVQFSGKATVGAVLGKVMAENPELRARALTSFALASQDRASPSIPAIFSFASFSSEAAPQPVHQG